MTQCAATVRNDEQAVQRPVAIFRHHLVAASMLSGSDPGSPQLAYSGILTSF